MALLSEFAVTPDVFDAGCYSNDDVCIARLDVLRKLLLESGIVRDLRMGEWFRIVESPNGRSCPEGRELVRKLRANHRLSEARPFLPRAPSDDREWCEEALAADRADPLLGIVANCVVAASYEGTPKVASINKLSKASWWKQKESIRPYRTKDAYLEELRPLIRHANSIMFIDPHMDFRETRYDGLLEILRATGGRDTTTLIELHRVCYTGSGKNRILLDLRGMCDAFGTHLAPMAASRRLKIDVFVWDDFHDRFLISDILGISVSNGFDTSGDKTEKGTWTRLSREDREDVQREFDPASGLHTLRARFTFEHDSNAVFCGTSVRIDRARSGGVEGCAPR